MELKGMNRYQTFGLRLDWLEHFLDMGMDCFSSAKLGNRQYDSLKVWLKEAGIIGTSDSRTLNITPLGERIIAMNAYNPTTWAYLWANVAYSSIICKWFMLNVEPGVVFDKGYLVDMLGDEAAPRTRENAVAALMDMLRSSPLGDSIGQGKAQLSPKNSYLRTGYETPDAVALLYSLYLYAEHTKHYTFTLTELIRAHESPNTPGVSPSDVFGIEPRKFREAVQGLALAYPNQIRVSFVNDLDNIVLDSNITSLSILDLAEK